VRRIAVCRRINMLQLSMDLRSRMGIPVCVVVYVGIGRIIMDFRVCRWQNVVRRLVQEISLNIVEVRRWRQRDKGIRFCFINLRLRAHRNTSKWDYDCIGVLGNTKGLDNSNGKWMKYLKISIGMSH
jgi:hypothetical protein